MNVQAAIGLPRALLYYEFGPAWEEFLRILGAEPVTSGATTRAKVELGLCQALDEACLPVKVAYGHCMHLAGDVDHIFVPRIVSVEPRAYSCPKLLGLPDMIRLAVPQRVRVLSPLVDLSRGSSSSLVRAAQQIAAVTGAGRRAVSMAARALAVGTCAEAQCRRPTRRAQITCGDTPPAADDGRPLIGLVGHSYNLLDDGLNLSLRGKLTGLGVRIVIPEQYSRAQVEEGAAWLLSKPLFWTLGRRLAGAAAVMSRDPAVEGIIAVVSFGCGPDSMVIELAERLIRRARPDLPFMVLTLDEHTGEAGLRTRLEAFSDLVARRRAC